MVALHPPFPVARTSVLALLLAVAVGLLPGCGSGGGGPVIPTGPAVTTCGGSFGPCGGGTGPVITIQGRILYERLVATATGLGPATETRPARYVDVEVRSAGGDTCYGRTSTDANGDYAILVTPDAGTEIEVAVFSRTTSSAQHDLTVHRALDKDLQRITMLTEFLKLLRKAEKPTLFHSAALSSSWRQ